MSSHFQAYRKLLVQKGLGILATAYSDVHNIRAGQVTAEDFDARIRLGRPFIIADAGFRFCSQSCAEFPWNYMHSSEASSALIMPRCDTLHIYISE